ncbi:MAG: hypothetical protein ABI640_10800 [Gammaproteobacteria bacterium]
MIFTEKDVNPPPSDEAGELADAKRNEDETRRSDIESAFREASSKSSADSDFESAGPLLDDLEARFPGRTAPEIVRHFASRHRAVMADPVNGGALIAREYSRDSRLFSGDRATAKDPRAADNEVTLTLPGGQKVYAAEGSRAHDVAKAVAASMRNDRDGEQLRELQHELTAAFPGSSSLTDGLRSMIAFDTAAQLDPVGAAVRLASANGAPLSPADVPVYQQTRALAQLIGPHFELPEFQSLKGREDEVTALVASGEVSIDQGIRGVLRQAGEVLAFTDTANAEIKAMAKSADFPRFKELRQDMAQALEEGKANSLPQAYKIADKAKRRHPSESERHEQRRADIQNAGNEAWKNHKRKRDKALR